MSDVLIYGDTFRTPELRHEVAVGIGDPFLYLERAGVRHAVVSSMEIPRMQELPDLQLHPPEDFGLDELRAAGLSLGKIRDEIHLRAVQRLGVTSATVPDGFALRLADLLRAAGVELATDQDAFDERRRVKNAAELAGIRRAQKAAELGMASARDLLRRATPGAGGLVVDGEPLTVDWIKGAIGAAFIANGTTFDEFIVSHGPQSAIAHHMGEGRIQPNEPIVIDVWPRDNETSCYADMTRTFVVGQPTDELRDWHRLVKQALDRAIADVKAGVHGRVVFDGTCDIFEAAGQLTQRTKKPGATLDRGFFHGLGHGVGLEVHEEPGLGLSAGKELQAGDVVTVEPGLYRPDVGGVRLEDLLLVTAAGAENLTSFPYDLTP